MIRLLREGAAPNKLCKVDDRDDEIRDSASANHYSIM